MFLQNYYREHGGGSFEDFFHGSIWIATKLSRFQKSAVTVVPAGRMDPELWAEQGMSREALEHQQAGRS